MSNEGLETSDGDFQRQLDAALPLANLPALQLLLVQFTGDLRWIREPFLPTRGKGVDDNDSGGLPEEVQVELRAGARDAILAWKAGKPMAFPDPSAELLVEMMSVSEGSPIPPEYADLMLDRMRSFREHVVPDLRPIVPKGFLALIVGAGMSGICSAITFKKAGIPYLIVDKQDDTSGVWHNHRYPGVSVDTPSHLYSYTFAGGDWTRYFAPGEEIDEYFRTVAKDHGIYDEIRFNTEVLSSHYDEAAQRWVSELRNPDGSVESVESQVLISAVGVFNEPIRPDIPGLDAFAGPVVHTARWDEKLSLAGKRVAVIGTGASSMQLVPAIVDDVESLVIFQRTRQWAAPFPKFHREIPEPLRFLMREVPTYQHWYRQRMSWIFDSKIYPSLHRDPSWPDKDQSLNAINAGHRRFFTRYITSELGDRQDLIDKVVPTYPPYGKRMLLDNGWFRTLTRPNVTLVDNGDDGVDHIEGSTIVTRQGERFDVDVVVLATGYKVARILATLPVSGRRGVSIRDAWHDTDPRAYLGTTVPDFPNMFMLYGPNTQLGHGGSFIFVMECQIKYVLSALEQMFTAGIEELECRREVYDEYNETIQRLHQGLVWTHPGMTTYVRNDLGRVVGNNPWRLVDFWKLLQRADLNDYAAR